MANHEAFPQGVPHMPVTARKIRAVPGHAQSGNHGGACPDFSSKCTLLAANVLGARRNGSVSEPLRIFQKGARSNPGLEGMLRKSAVEALFQENASYSGNGRFMESACTLMLISRILEGADPVRARQILAESVSQYISGGDHLSSLGKNRDAYDYYLAAAETARRLCPGLARSLLLEAACAAELGGDFPSASSAYIRARDEFRSGCEEKWLEERLLASSILGNPSRREQTMLELGRARPSLFEVVSRFDDADFVQRYRGNERDFLSSLRARMGLDMLEEAARRFLSASRDEIRFSPDNLSRDIQIFTRGAGIWASMGFRDPEGIQPWFVFPALAISNGDEARLSLLRKVCGSKIFRHSRDRRKELLWHLQDRLHDPAGMEMIFTAIGVSSSKKALENLRSLSILQGLGIQVLPSDFSTQDGFHSLFRGSLRKFALEKTGSEDAASRFLERWEEFHSSGFMRTFSFVYSRCGAYPRALRLLDMMLAAYTMGDFQKVKFPSPEGVAALNYLSPSQKELLLESASQLDFLGPLAQPWKEDFLISRPGLTAYDSADAFHLLNVGLHPENSGSCIRPDSNPSKAARLVSISMNGNIRVLRAEDSSGRVLARALFRAVLADGKPALFIQSFYTLDKREVPDALALMREVAALKAQRMGGIPVLCAYPPPSARMVSILMRKGAYPDEDDCDEIGGDAMEILPNGDKIRKNIPVKVLCGSL